MREQNFGDVFIFALQRQALWSEPYSAILNEAVMGDLFLAPSSEDLPIRPNRFFKIWNWTKNLENDKMKISIFAHIPNFLASFCNLFWKIWNCTQNPVVFSTNGSLILFPRYPPTNKKTNQGVARTHARWSYLLSQDQICQIFQKALRACTRTQGVACVHAHARG